jgi:dihydrofolate reductase
LFSPSTKTREKCPKKESERTSEEKNFFKEKLQSRKSILGRETFQSRKKNFVGLKKFKFIHERKKSCKFQKVILHQLLN